MATTELAEWALQKLLIGDLSGAHPLGDGPLRPDEVARTIAALPPLVDVDVATFRAQRPDPCTGRWRLRLPLRAAHGPTGISLLVDLAPSCHDLRGRSSQVNDRR